MSYFGNGDDLLRTMTERAENAEAELRARDHKEIMAAETQRIEEVARRQALAEAEGRRLHAEELEETRQSAWFLKLTDPSDAEQFRRLIEEDRLDPAKIRARIPAEGWPEGDSAEQHSFRHPAVRDGNIVPPGTDAPSLVQKARAMGIAI